MKVKKRNQKTGNEKTEQKNNHTSCPFSEV